MVLSQASASPDRPESSSVDNSISDKDQQSTSIIQSTDSSGSVQCSSRRRHTWHATNVSQASHSAQEEDDRNQSSCSGWGSQESIRTGSVGDDEKSFAVCSSRSSLSAYHLFPLMILDNLFVNISEIKKFGHQLFVITNKYREYRGCQSRAGGL
ncbi:unnamed protein product [Gongylonema pulchrum]|uniref:GRAM domain containing 1C n=1 Tax=Gongylonema pulchrum TaxID=637853 RepID=A0A183ENU8_9BILA|nr:unnamed protein product [Gongylonema pulchrum]